MHKLIFSWMMLLPLLHISYASADDAVDQEVEKIKPRPEDSVQMAASKCARLAAASKARGANLLIIGIEGQDGFSAGNAWQVYRYLWQITHGMNVAPPDLNTSAPVLHRLLLPLIDYFGAKIEVLNFPETSVQADDGGQAQACAMAWVNGIGAGARLVLMGHSFGGDGIRDLATLLGVSGVPVYQAYSMDPIARDPAKRFHKPANVGQWTNFVQRNQPPFGSIIVGAKNWDVSGDGANHRTIVRSAPVTDMIHKQLKLR